jgi:acyl-CoA thioesterase I
MGMPSDELLRYVALGDSTSLGVGAGDDGGFPERLYRRLKAAKVPAGILNLGRSGATSADLAAGLAAGAARRRPHLVTLGIGTNDVWRMVPVSRFAENLERIVDPLLEGGTELVVCNLADLGLAPAAVAAQQWVGISPAQITRRIREFNVHLDALAGRPGCAVVDLFVPSQRQLAGNPALFCPDGFHPSAQGYDGWAELMWPAVQAAAERWLASRRQTATSDVP